MTSTAEMLAVEMLEGLPNSSSSGGGSSGSSSSSSGGDDSDSDGGGRVGVALFHTPALRGLLKRVLPARVREVVGVCHWKLYVFDDSGVRSRLRIGGMSCVCVWGGGGGGGPPPGQAEQQFNGGALLVPLGLNSAAAYGVMVAGMQHSLPLCSPHLPLASHCLLPPRRLQ